MSGTVIVAGARTPIGKLSGALGGFAATELGGFAIAGALERAGITPDQVDYVFMGQVILAGTGQITARQAAVKAGIPMTVPATTVNKVCLSGLNAIYLADLMINAGEADIVVAGGMESMTQAPYLLPGARAGYRIGDGTIVDSMMYDGLFCAFDSAPWASPPSATTGPTACPASARTPSPPSPTSGRPPPSRTASSPTRSSRSSVPQRKGDPLVVDTDEGVRPETTAESLAKLRPAFDKTGTITAGNASQISDGGAAVIVMSKAKAEELGLTPLGELVGYGQVAGPDPVAAPPALPRHPGGPGQGRAHRQDIDLFEINEAFAAVGCASADDLGISDDVVNVNGGAIALGHPVGMSGTRLALTALLELKRRGGGTAAVSLCGGGGQGDAAILRTL